MAYKSKKKSIQTSNKKHFMKNVKECRDVIVKKVLSGQCEVCVPLDTFGNVHLIAYLLVPESNGGENGFCCRTNS